MKLLGVNKVLANMTLRVHTASGKIPKVLWNAGRLVERRAKENISGKHGHQRHVITGNLMKSIDTKRPYKTAPHTYSVPIGTDVHYAIHVEHRDKTGGFLFPALKEGKAQATDYIKRELRGELGLL